MKRNRLGRPATLVRSEPFSLDHLGPTGTNRASLFEETLHMVSIKDEAKPAIELQKKPISLLSWASDTSVTREIWNRNVGAVNNFFSGGTDEEDEDKALRIIM